MSAHILLVEDNSADAELLEREIRAAVPEAVVHRAARRGEFVREMGEFKPELVVCDHNLVDSTGRQILEMAKRVDPDIAFVLVTGSLDEETAVEYMKAGAADYLIKDRLARLGPAVIGALGRARQRRALTRQQMLLRKVLDTDPNLIFVKDWDGRFVLVNQAVAELFGISVEKLVGQRDGDLSPRPEEGEAHLRDDREVMSSRAPKVIPEQAVTSSATGVTRWFQTIKVPLILDGDGPPLVLGVGTDITDRKRLEEQLRQAQKMEAIGQLAGGVAHDFNNVLTAILGYAELLLQDPALEHPRREDVEEIRKAGERAASLTRQLLAFSRKQVLQPRVLDLNALVADVEKMLRRLLGEDIELQSRLAPDLDAVLADPGQMEQVIVNLAVNARDAMPEGGRLTIETANVELDPSYAAEHVAVTPGRYVMLAVSDTGIGMDRGTQLRLFEPFFTTKGPGKGTGLGLSTVYGIVKQSGGHIFVYSEPGRGATFKIYLPRVAEAAQPEEARADPVALGGPETVLLVEDAESVRTLTRRALESYGYVVLEASGGSEAIRLATEYAGTIHLLLTDAVMPELSGIEVARQVADLRPGLRVVFMSGYADSTVAHSGVIEEGVAYLEKPFTPAVLARKVRAVLDAP